MYKTQRGGEIINGQKIGKLGSGLDLPHTNELLRKNDNSGKVVGKESARRLRFLDQGRKGKGHNRKVHEWLKIPKK